MASDRSDLRGLVLSGEWRDAVLLCEQNRAGLTDREKVYFIRSYYELGEYSSCIQLCDDFSELTGKDKFSSMKYKLRSLRKSGEDSKAIEHAIELTKEKVVFEEAYVYLARMSMSDRQTEAARIWLSKLLVRSPMNTEGLRLYARLIDKSSLDYEIRLMHWGKILAILPEDIEARYKSARALMGLGEIDKASEKLSGIPSGSKFSNEVNRISREISENQDSKSLLTYAKEKYVNKEFLDSLRILNRSEKPSNTEKIWIIRCLTALGKIDKIEQFWKENKKNKQHVNVHLTLAEGFAKTNFSQSLIENLRSAAVSLRNEKEALRVARIALDSTLNLSQIVKIFDLFSTEMAEEIAKDLVMLVARRNRGDILENQHFKDKFISKSKTCKLVSSILNDGFDWSEVTDLDSSFVNSLGTDLIMKLDYQLRRSENTLILDQKMKLNVLDQEITKSIINGRLIAYSQSGNEHGISELLNNLPVLSEPLSANMIQKIIINLSSAGKDPFEAYLLMWRKMRNFAKGELNTAVAGLRCGIHDLGEKIWKNALSRYVLDPENETTFLKQTWELGNLKLIRETYDRIFLDLESIFLVNEVENFREFCTKWESISDFIDSHPLGISEGSERDENLLEVAILSSMIEELHNENHSDFVPNRVIHVTNSIRIGGAERQVIYSLQKQNTENELALFNLSRNTYENSFIEKVEKIGIKIHDYSEERKVLLPDRVEKMLDLIPTGPGLNPWMKRQIRSLVGIFRERKPQVVHLWQDGTNIIGGVAALLAGVPKVVLSARSIPPYTIKDSTFPEKGISYFVHNRYTRILYNSLLKHSNFHITFNSERCSDYYLDWMGVGGVFDRFSVIHNAVQLDGTKNRSEDLEGMVIGGVFRLKEVKQPILWLEVAEYVSNRYDGDLTFVILGDGPMWRNCIEWINERNMADKINMLGFSSDVSDRLESFDLLLQTSLVEGLPNTLIEAQLTGTPVVTTDAGGSRETIIDGLTGHVVNSFEPEIIGDCVLKVLRDDPWRREASVRSEFWAKSNFSIEKMLASLDEIYVVKK